MTYLLAGLAAVANALASILQRKSDRGQPTEKNLSLRLIVGLLHEPTWFLGILAVIAGFLLQAAALGTGPLSVVEPVLIIELPLTLLLARPVFGQRLGRQQWAGVVAMTGGLAGLLYFLSPTAGSRGRAAWPVWTVGLIASLALVGGLVALAQRSSTPQRRSALLGVATGVAFGLTAALIAAMTGAFRRHGFLAIFLTWQTYAMVATGLLAMFLLQSALNAGPLVAAQPGFTGADPVVSILWGTLAFGEQVRGGFYPVLALGAAAMIGVGVVLLSRSEATSSGNGGGNATPGSANSGSANSGPTDRSQPAQAG